MNAEYKAHRGNAFNSLEGSTMLNKRNCMCAAAAILVLVAIVCPLVIYAAQTVDNNLKTGAHFSTRVAVPFGSGNWVTVNLNPDKKYYIRNFGFDHTGATSSNRVKVLLNSAAEPDAGSVVTFTAALDDEIMKPDDIIYPLRGTSSISMKAETAEVMVAVRTIEVLSATER